MVVAGLFFVAVLRLSRALVPWLSRGCPAAVPPSSLIPPPPLPSFLLVLLRLSQNFGTPGFPSSLSHCMILQSLIKATRPGIIYLLLFVFVCFVWYPLCWRAVSQLKIYSKLSSLRASVV